MISTSLFALSNLRKFLMLVFLLVFTIPTIPQETVKDPLGWPRKIEVSEGTITIYQPQVESFDGNELQARAALSVTTPGHPEPVFGAAWFDCTVSTNRDERTVSLTGLKVPVAKFPDAKEEHVEKLKSILEEEIPKWEIVMSLDQLVADIELNGDGYMDEAGYNNAPPEIIYSSVPAVLILIDGEPIIRDIEDGKYEYVVNTPFFIVKEKNGAAYYLKGGEYWYSSGKITSGWEPASKVPKNIIKLAEQVVDQPDSSETGSGNPEGSGPPAIIVRTIPAELILTNGDPNFAAVEGTSLLYLKNTDSDIIMDINTQHYYLLVSGRWYATKSLTQGPWEYVAPEALPADFRAIPEDSDIGNVRASVFGTDESREAVIDNSIPQTATVDRASASLEVSYDGSPKFEKIKGTSMEYAVNTQSSVLKIDGRYYCVDNGVWFESGSPSGPWEVSVKVPESVDEIPPESPVYNVKYVYIYDYTPEVVYVGYTPGYVHSYVYHGCVVYGTGWYYRPWYGAYYYPRPVTYGFGVHYNPYTGWGFSFGVSVGGPAGWFSMGWHSPYYGYWGPAGYRHGYYQGYHRGYAQGYARGYYYGNRSGSQAGQVRPSGTPSTRPSRDNVYANRGNGIRETGGNTFDPRNGERIATRESGRPAASPRPSTREKNNVFTDREGNVYRKDGDSWQKREDSRWKDAPGAGSRDARPADRQAPDRINDRQPQTMDRSTQPAGRPAQNVTRSPQTRPNDLNREYDNRSRGSQRTQQFNNNRSNYQYSRPSAPTRSSPSGGRQATPARRR